MQLISKSWIAACGLILLSSGLSAQTMSSDDWSGPASIPNGVWSLSGGGDHSHHHGGSHHEVREPARVMAGHSHGAGEWMVSVRASRMHMEGMRSNQDQLSDAQVFAEGFMVTPTEMDMDMLMFGAMYAPTADWTLTLMAPYIRNSMDHVTGMGGRFTTESEGIGDLTLGGIYSLSEGDGQRVQLNFGLSIPTGSVKERDDLPIGPDGKLPYPMQLGTGTLDLLPGVTWLLDRGPWSFGAQGTYRIHTGTNSEDYTRGDRFNATAWTARQAGALSYSLRVNALHWENFDGADPELPLIVPTARPDLQGGDRVDVSVGVSTAADAMAPTWQRTFLEFGVPVYQNLDGPQLETDWILTLGWQYSF